MPEDGTVARQLHNLSEEDPERPAFIFRGAQAVNNKPVLVLTREDVFQLAGRFASMVRDAGVKQGEVVCNTLPSSPERLITDLGLILAGAVAMNGPVFLVDGTDLLSCLIGSDCVALVADSKQPDNALTVLSKNVCVRGDNAQCTEVPSLKKVFDVDCGGGKDWRPWLEQVKLSDQIFLAKVSAQDMAYIFTTSDAWGFHKLVARTHEQFIAIGQIFHDVMELAPGDVLFNECSMGSLWGSSCTYVATGITRVLVDMTLPPDDPLDFAWHSCNAERCSVAVMLPPQIYSIISKPAQWKDKKHKPRNIVTGGMPLCKQQVSAVGRLCDALIIVYASTEGGYIGRKRITQDNVVQFDLGDIGEPVGGYVFKLITDQEEEIRPSQIGVTGELVLKGPQMFNGYMGANYSIVTVIYTTDGWLKTKDIACYNPCGNVHIICRKYNEIIHGARIINPFWLEKKLETCPGVNSAMVVPVPDPKVYQEMCMCIVPALGDERPTEAAVKAYCQSLAVPGSSDCVPRYMLLFDQFPMTKNGEKPDRKQIFAIAMEKLFSKESFSTSQVLF